MTLIIIGLGLLILGASYRFNLFPTLDLKTVRSLQGLFGEAPHLTWFREIWFFGRTAFTLTALIALAGLAWKLGLSALVVFGLVAALEKGLKAAFKRSRPFTSRQEITLLQPLEPTDPSFPSGDALRIWYLASILTAASGELAFGIIAILLAVLVSLGRMVLGVHYLSDVLAGTGLGLLGGGITIWLWQTFHLIG